MAEKTTISKTFHYTGEVYEGGGDSMIIKGDKVLTALDDKVNGVLYQFNKKKVKVVLKIEVEEID